MPPSRLPRHVDLAVLGSGPVGIDAALAARDADLDVLVLEAGDRVADGVRRWGHVRLFTPWSMNLSERMQGRLRQIGRPMPEDATCPTGAELVREVLEPLAEGPLADRIVLGHRVVGVAREGLLKHEAIGDPVRASRRFRLLVEGPEGRTLLTADRVLDCTGCAVANALGDGGIPALGEETLADRIDHDIPDPAADPGSWAGRRILLVGGGHSAQTAARSLVALAREAPDTRIVWLLRSAPPPSGWGSPEDDPLAERRTLAEDTTRLVHERPEGLEVVTGVVEEIRALGGEAVATRVRGTDGSVRTFEVDRIVALTGRVGDAGLYRQLQVHECYATSGPMKLAAALLGASGGAGGDCLTQSSPGADVLRNPEPGFFVLGAKSYGRRNDFLLRVGYEQVEQVMDLLAGDPVSV